MQNHHQNTNNNLNNPLQLKSEQVALKPLPVSTPAKFEKDKYADLRRARFTNFENVALYICDLSGAEAYTYTLKGRFILAVFTARSKKPVFHYAFSNDTDRTERLEGFFNAQRRDAARRIEARAARFNYEVKLVEGDILYTSWGWEQTNVDFYQVIHVINKKIVVRKIARTMKKLNTWQVSVHQFPVFLCLRNLLYQQLAKPQQKLSVSMQMYSHFKKSAAGVFMIRSTKAITPKK